jgi:hypothetical protein
LVAEEETKMPIPAACQSIADQLAAAQKILAQLQKPQGPTDPHPGKPENDPDVRAQRAKVHELAARLASCEAAHQHTSSTPCKSQADQLAAAMQALASLQSSPGFIQGRNDPHPGKPDPEMLKEAEALEAKIRQLRNAYNKCLCDAHVLPAEAVTFHASITVEGSTKKFESTLSFPQGRKHFSIIDFPVLNLTIQGHTVTVTLTNSKTGNFNADTGAMDIVVSLDADIHPDPAGSFTISNIDLSTKGSGSPVSSSGVVTLVGSGTAIGHGAGTPDSLPITITVTGTLSPNPRTC